MATKSRRKRFTTMYKGTPMARIAGEPGKKPVTFEKGALHRMLGIPEGQKIPGKKMAAARAGQYGKLAQKRANFDKGMLSAGRATANRNRP